MPKDTPVTHKEVVKVVLYLGYVLKTQRGSHQHYKKEGTGTGKVTIPLYKKPLGNDLLMWICRQLKISKKKFYNILEQIG